MLSFSVTLVSIYIVRRMVFIRYAKKEEQLHSLALSKGLTPEILYLPTKYCSDDAEIEIVEG